MDNKILYHVTQQIFLPLSSESNSQRPEGQMATLMENMVLFSQKFLEKLYSGMFLVEPKNLLTFLADQIVVVRNTLNAMCCHGCK